MSDVLTSTTFPAIVTDAAGTVWRSARVFTSTDRLWVYVDGGGQPTLMVDEQFTRQLVAGDGASEFVLSDGSTITVRKGGGCGCGSPLRSMVAPDGVAPRYGT